MSKRLTPMQQALAVMSAVSDGQLDAATTADMRQLLDAAAGGGSLSKGLNRAIAAARSRTFEAVADAAIDAAAGDRAARSRLKAATASAAAVRGLELRLTGAETGSENDTSDDTSSGAVSDVETAHADDTFVGVVTDAAATDGGWV